MKKTLQTIGVATLALLIAVSAVVPAVTASAQTAPAGSCYLYVRDLTIGSTGADVVALQTFLVVRGHLVMPIGVPMGYFGTLTRAAVAKYQASKGIMPTAGYFGPITRGRIALECQVTPTPPGDDDDDDDNDDLSGGEASLEQFQFDTGNDSSLEENDSAEIAEIEFDVEDGDVRINRVDLTFSPSDTNEEEDPWDTFESVRLLVDGDEIAEADLSDEDDWLDEDEPYVFRLSNIDHIVREGESANIVVELTAQNSVDGADNNLAEWTLYVDDSGIRAEDAEGIQQYVGDEDETVTFDLEVEGEGEELKVRSSTEDPDSTTFQVEDDERSDTHSIFAFDLESEERDIEIDTVQINLESSAAVANVISDLVLEIDGEEFDDWSFVGTGSTTRTVQFDIDKDFILDADSEVTVVLKAEFKAANGTNYSSGATVRASIGSGDVEGEGADDIESTGSVTGDTHQLGIEGIIVSVNEDSAVAVTNSADIATDDEGRFTFEFDVEAFQESAFIKLDAARGTTTSPTAGINYVVETSDGFATTTGTVNATVELIDNGNEDGGYAEVEEGETATFRVIVNFNPGHPTGSGVSYRVRLDSVNFNDAENTSPDTRQVLSPAQDYRTSFVSIQN